MKAVVALSRSFKLPQSAVAEKDTVGEQRWRGVRIGNLPLLIPHNTGGEVLENPNVCVLPHTQRWCRGLINLRGRLLPAFDLHEYFALERIKTVKPYWLVLGTGDEAVALPIDGLPVALHTQGAAHLQPAALPEGLRAFVPGAIRIENDLWLKFEYRDFFRALTPHAAA